MADEDSYLNRSIGNYRTVALIGSGGFGSVYRGVHSILQERMVAIKILHTYLSSPEERSRFLEEARLLEHIRHPHILQVFDVGIENGVPYLVMEYAPHGSLRDLLKQHAHSTLPENVSLTILSQVGEALYHSHQQHVVHRDLKPENILFNANGMALLADFGIATTLSTSSVKYSSVIGTPSYMAPEQFQGTLSKEGDQYALGCIAYELFTGHVPFTAPDFFAVGFKHLTDKPVAPTQLNPGLPLHIEQAILKAMAKQRADRHKDVQAFIAALYSTERSLPDSYNVSLSTDSLTQIIVKNPVSASSPEASDAPTFIPINTASINQQSPEQTFQLAREGTLPASQEPAAPFSSVPPRATPSDSYAQEPFTPTIPASFTSSQRRTDRPDVWEPIAEPVAPSQQISTPPYRYEERQWGGVGQMVAPTGGSWNREAAYLQKRNGRRRGIIMVTACAIVALAVIGSLLFIILPNFFPAHTMTVQTTLAGTTATIATTTGPTATPRSKSQSHPTSASSSTPTPTSATTFGSTTGSTATAVATTAPTATPTATPTFTPTPTPTPTKHTETFNVLFDKANTSGQEVTTQYAYSGTISLTISGSGQASNTQYSDAYYIYTDSYGTPVTPHTNTCWVLFIDGKTADSYTGLPSPSSSHVYNVTMSQSQAASITFGICDGQPSDNTGYLTVTVSGY